MDRNEETLFIRKLQDATKEELKNFIYFKDSKKENYTGKEGYFTLLSFDVIYQNDKGYLNIGIDENKKVILAEMDVNFKTPLGLNRSPLELKILAEVVLRYFDDDL